MGLKVKSPLNTHFKIRPSAEYLKYTWWNSVSATTNFYVALGICGATSCSFENLFLFIKTFTQTYIKSNMCMCKTFSFCYYTWKQTICLLSETRILLKIFILGIQHTLHPLQRACKHNINIVFNYNFTTICNYIEYH